MIIDETEKQICGPILIADEEPRSLVGLKQILEKLNLNIALATTNTEALKKIKH